MGMGKMFSNEADFSGISESPLKVSKVVQKAFIQVDEEGAEAAAATGKFFKLLLPASLASWLWFHIRLSRNFERKFV